MVLLIAKITLAAILVLAGLGKLADRAGSRRSMADFGVPTMIAGPVAIGVAICEVATAALLATPGYTVGAVGALALLAGFTGIVAVNVAIGRTPDCHCFGRLSSGPVGWSTVARNALLATLAAYVAANGRALPAFAAVALASAGLWLWLGPLQQRPRLDRAAPNFSVVDEGGETRTLDSLLAPRAPVLLVFSHPGCPACDALLPEIGRWQLHFADRITIAVVTRGVAETSQRTAMDSFLIDASGAVARAYGITATPSAVLVDERGRVASATARGASAILNLVAGVLAPAAAPRFSRRGLLEHAALGVASLGLLPLLAAAFTGKARAQQPKSLFIDGAYLCDQRFALCTDAACLPSPTDPGIVICNCAIEGGGYSVGFKSCDERAPRGDGLHSNFSTALVTSTSRSMTCPEQIQWANCLDVPCTVDPTDPTRANCDCLLVNTGPSVTFGGNCDTATCNSVIWSAATPDLPGSTQLEKGMNQLGIPITLPKPCAK